jgi:hypothetical protein
MRKPAVILLGAAAALALLAPPAQAGTSAAPATRPVVLSNADNGAALTVTKGQTVVVALHSVQGQSVRWVWSEPQSSDPTVLVPEGSRVLADGSAGAVFLAAGSGTATVTSVESCRAQPGHVCSALGILWRADVTVTP